MTHNLGGNRFLRKNTWKKGDILFLVVTSKTNKKIILLGISIDYKL